MPDIGKLLWPKSVALVGASSDTDGLRGRILRVMRGHHFAGQIYPVSRSANKVQGLKAYPAVAELPEPVDLAVLIIPAAYIPDELERCGRAGVRAAIILSSGFAESLDKSGSKWQDEIRAIAVRYDMAVGGPNAEGFVNSASALCPTFSPVMEPDGLSLAAEGSPVRGQVSVVAQSGGLGFAFFDRGRSKGLDFRYIVTTGNEACLETFDFVEYMLDEGKSDVFLLLLEDIKSPATFERVAKKALKAGKPLIVSKLGQSEPGSRAAVSHTAALAGCHATYRAMFDHYGVIQGHDLDEMVDMTRGFLALRSRLPAGKRVGICTSSGGGGAWLADACVVAGLDVPLLDDETRATIDVHLPPYGSSQNPVDTTAQGVHKVGYAEFARLVSQSPAIDAVIVAVTARSSRFLEDDQERLMRLASEAAKPVLMWSYTLPCEKSTAILNEAGYPLFTNAHACARTLQAMADYRATRERFLRPIKVSRPPSMDRQAVHAELAAAGPILCEWRARSVLAHYGIGNRDAGILARSRAEAEAAAAGGSVALKVQSVDLPHKAEAGAVALGLAGRDAVGAGYDRVLAAARRFAPTARIDGVLVQPMAPPGREVIVGVKRDARWGATLMVGLGGVLVELLGDVVWAPVPLNHEEARTLIRRLKGAKLFDACRRKPAADLDALTELMVRVSEFAADHAERISEIDLNPVLVHESGQGLSVVDALIIQRDDSVGKRRDRAVDVTFEEQS